MARLDFPSASMMMASEVPMMHLVPAATGWAALHTLAAQCWKDLPSIQFHIPSVVQAPVINPPEVVEVPGDVGLDGADGEEGGEEEAAEDRPVDGADTADAEEGEEGEEEGATEDRDADGADEVAGLD